MIGHKTSGNWADVTSFGRNEIVFEGRNKEYGAFAVRQRYNNALLLALLIAGSIGVLSAGIPFVWQYLHKEDITLTTVTSVDLHPKIVNPDVHKPFTPPPPPTTPPHNPPPANKFTPIKLEKNDSQIDSTLTHEKIDQSDVGNKTTPKDPNDQITVNIPGGPGGGGIIDPPKDEPPLTVVQVMPQFNGSLDQYLKDNIKLPESEMERGVSGTVYLTFVVEKDGSITGVRLNRGVAGGPGYDAEAIRVVKAMPKWSPGQQNGHEVRVQFNLPVKFIINGR